MDGYTSKHKKVFRADFNTYFKLINDVDSTSCPEQIYEYVDYNKVTFIPYKSDLYGKLNATYSLSDCKSAAPSFDADDIGCEIFSDSLRKIINEVMSYIRIGVPLLLIILLGIDFAKATFSGDEKAISKSKNNAIKRIIIAIVIFFVPTLLNILFDVANNVWKNANYEICVLNDKNE